MSLNLNEIAQRVAYHRGRNGNNCDETVGELCDKSEALLRALRETRTALQGCVHTIQEEWGDDAAEDARTVLAGVLDD